MPTSVVAASGAHPRDAGSLDGTAGKRFKISVVALLVLGVWGHARFGGEASLPVQSTQHVGPFAEPQSFIAAPGGSFARINLRAGSGAEFRVKGELARGERVTGVARTTDARGAFWIELADGQGFAKESVLSPVTK